MTAHILGLPSEGFDDYGLTVLMTTVSSLLSERCTVSYIIDHLSTLLQ